MKAFLEPLHSLAEFDEIYKKAKTNKGILQVSGCIDRKPILCMGFPDFFHVV